MLQDDTTWTVFSIPMDTKLVINVRDLHNALLAASEGDEASDIFMNLVRNHKVEELA